MAASVVLLFFLLMLTGAGCGDSGVTAGITTVEAQQPPAEPPVALPNKDGSFKFGVLGDFGTGSRSQYQLAEQTRCTRQATGTARTSACAKCSSCSS